MDYEIEVFAEGEAYDVCENKKYRITSKTFRALGDAEADWYHATRDVEQGWYGSVQEYLNALAAVGADMKEFEAAIARALGWDGKTFTVEHVVSEVFCAVLIEEIEEMTVSGGEKG